ncbi:MAG: hypothetical protein ACOYJY_03070 [Acutalibacteraceae bacterium]|jgi:phosphate/sulfate permease
MTSDRLIDALGLLDDDLIEEVDRLRQPRPKVIRWKRWAALAAAAVVAFAGVGAMAAIGIGPFAVTSDTAKNASTSENASPADDGVAESVQDKASDLTRQNGADDGAGAVENEAVTGPVQSSHTQTVTVRLVTWREDGFTAVLIDDGGNELLAGVEEVLILTDGADRYPPGSLLTIRFDQTRVGQQQRADAAVPALTIDPLQIEPV